MTALVAVSEPDLKRITHGQLDAIELLNQCMRRMMMLSSAHHEFLLDPEDETRYNIGPRSTEIEVIYHDPSYEKPQKATLQALINRIEKRFDTESMKWKAADPRSEIRATTTAISALITQMIELAAMLADAAAMQTFRESLLSEIAKVSPDVAERIATAVRRRLVLHSGGGGSAPLDADFGDAA
jgi:hypothetical protein